MKTRTNPALIRAALLDARRSSNLEAAARAGVAFSTVCKWQKYAEAHPGWPTDRDIATWRQAAEDHRIDRQHDRESTKRRILAGRPLLVDPTGTRRRTRALLALGWGRGEISEASGLSLKHICRLMGDTQLQAVQLSTHEAIAEAFEAMSMTRPAGGWHDHHRREAAALGYHPPLAWERIDDPRDRPSYSGRSWRDTLICHQAVTAAAETYNTTSDVVLADTYDPTAVNARTAVIGAAHQLGVQADHIADYLDRHPHTITKALARIAKQPELARSTDHLHRLLTRPAGLQRTAATSARSGAAHQRRTAPPPATTPASALRR